MMDNWRFNTNTGSLTAANFNVHSFANIMSGNLNGQGLNLSSSGSASSSYSGGLLGSGQSSSAVMDNAVTNWQSNKAATQSGRFDLEDIREIAKERWLKPNELEALLLLQTSPPLPIVPTKPSLPPPSGTILLYNRSSTGDYKNDGHTWTKRNNSNKVREDHVKLRIGGIQRISGSYVHGAGDSSSMKRRAYHLLDYRTGKTIVRPRIAGVKKVDNDQYADRERSSAAAVVAAMEDNLPSLVLVHYLDTVYAPRNASNKGISISRKRSSGVLEEHSNKNGDDLGKKASGGSSTGCNNRGPTISPEAVPSLANLPTTGASALSFTNGKAPSSTVHSSTGSALPNSVLHHAELQSLISHYNNYDTIQNNLGNGLSSSLGNAFGAHGNLANNPDRNNESINNAINSNNNNPAFKQWYSKWLLEQGLLLL